MEGESIAALREASTESTATGAKTVVPHKTVQSIEPLAVVDPSTWEVLVKRSTSRFSIQYRFPSKVPEQSLVLTFAACTVPGQYTYFPNGNETYIEVTAEVSDIILAACRALCRVKGSLQVDRAVPLFTDDDDSRSEYNARVLTETFGCCL